MGAALKGGTLQEWSEPLITSLHDIAADEIDEVAELIRAAERISGNRDECLTLIENQELAALNRTITMVSRVAEQDRKRLAELELEAHHGDTAKRRGKTQRNKEMRRLRECIQKHDDELTRNIIKRDKLPHRIAEARRCYLDDLGRLVRYGKDEQGRLFELRGKAPIAALEIDAAHTQGVDPSEVWVSVFKPGMSPLRVLLTEAHWAKDFIPAKAGSTVLWSWQVVLLAYWRMVDLLHWNLYQGVNWAKPTVLRALLWGVPTLIAAVLIFAMTFLLLVLLTVLVPLTQLVPGVAARVRALVMVFSEYFGDPVVWTKKPTQAASMRQRVINVVEMHQRRDVAITVVAHSQGAAVSSQVVLTGRIKPDNFVTVGSGLNLLGYAKMGGGTSGDPVTDWGHFTPSLRWVNLWGKFDFVPSGPMRNDIPNEQAKRPWAKIKESFPWSRSSSRKTLAWIYGPQDGECTANVGPEEHALYNRSDIIKDHIVYSKNRIDLIDPLAQLVYDNRRPNEDPATAAGSMEESGVERSKEDSRHLVWLNPPSSRVSEKEKERQRVHRRMVSFLGMTRLLCLVTGVSLAHPLLTLMVSEGRYQEVSRCSDKDRGWWLQWLPCDLSEQSSWVGAPWATAVVALLITIPLLAALNGMAWNFFHGRLERRRNSRLKPTSQSTRYFVYYISVVLISVLVLSRFGSFAGPPTGLLSGSWTWELCFAVLAAILFWLSWKAGRPIAPLPARLPIRPERRLV